MEIRNNLAELRHKRGLGAAELASQVGVTRQTVYSMEAGSYVPNTVVALKLARVLGVRVEELFRIEDEPEPTAHIVEDVDVLSSERDVQPGQPVQVCRVGKRLVAAGPEAANWNLPPADGVLVEGAKGADRKGRASVQLFHDEKELGKRLLIAGCDPGVSVLARHLQRAGVELVVVNRNSSQALDLLKQGLVHIAGSHLRDRASGESNLPAIRSRFARGSVAVIGFAVWEQGLVVARGNPKAIRSIADLGRKDVTIVNREPGAGCRNLLDEGLAQAGVPIRRVSGYDQIAPGHLPAAWHVLSGRADCCIATRAAARVFGLSFLPLLAERYDLVIRKPDLDRPEMQVLLDALGRAAFRRELEGLGGYDAAASGTRVA
jgi:molybdate-binding protein/DNA-binding XRE family transcriptional regulator